MVKMVFLNPPGQFLLEVYREPFLTEPIYIFRTVKHFDAISTKFKPALSLQSFLTFNNDNQISLNNEGLYYVENYLLDKPIDVTINIDESLIYMLKMFIGIKNRWNITKFKVIPG